MDLEAARGVGPRDAIEPDDRRGRGGAHPPPRLPFPPPLPPKPPRTWPPPGTAPPPNPPPCVVVDWRSATVPVMTVSPSDSPPVISARVFVTRPTVTSRWAGASVEGSRMLTRYVPF